MREHVPGATPGPWNTAGIVYLNEGRYMNVWGPTPPGEQSGQVVAYKLSIPDAHLISAAPDLLEVCKAVVEQDSFRGSGLMRQRIEAMKTAIAKAEGKISL